MSAHVALAGAMVCVATGSLILGVLCFRGVVAAIMVGSDSPLIDHHKHYRNARRLFKSSRVAFPCCMLVVLVGVGGIVFVPEVASPSLRAVLGALLLSSLVTPVLESVVFVILAIVLRLREEKLCYYEDAVEAGLFEDGGSHGHVI